MSLDTSNQFFLNWLFSWESGKEIFHKIGLTSETKKFTIQENIHHLGHVKLIFWLAKNMKNLDMRCSFFHINFLKAWGLLAQKIY